jgi:hypothetical protein
MTAVNLSSLAGAGAQFFDDNGVPLSGGKLYTYAAGTTTPAVTYTSSAGVTANANPIVLDAAGRAASEIWLVSNARYKFILKTAADVQIWSFDNIPGILEVSSITAADIAFTGFNAQDGTVEDLAGDDGADWIGYTPSGIGAVAQSVQEKLQKVLINRDDYDTVVNFDAAVTANPTIPSLDDDGNFAAKITPAGENAQIDLDAAVLTVAAGPRDALCYAGAQSMRVFRNYATMGGFRFRGQYSKGRAPTFAMPSNKTASMTTDLGSMSATTFENWYAVFACADVGDATATLKIMPFLRAGVVSGSSIGLIKAGEGQVSDVTQTYAWSTTNNLAGTDLLVITENGGFSGRVTSITANSASSITVDTIGSIADHDTFLPAPPGFDHYVYLGSFYEDTAEVRNIYDSGTLVKAKMIYTLYPDTSTGSFPYPTFTTIDCTGYIAPLATAVVLDSSCTLSTASVGSYAEYFAGDASNHVVQSAYVQKDNASNLTVVFDNIQVPFLYPQQFSYANAGSLAATRVSGQFNITGWFEP